MIEMDLFPGLNARNQRRRVNLLPNNPITDLPQQPYHQPPCDTMLSQAEEFLDVKNITHLVPAPVKRNPIY
jgi:hypothetical protein